jgi:hypothetical protein
MAAAEAYVGTVGDVFALAASTTVADVDAAADFLAYVVVVVVVGSPVFIASSVNMRHA